MEVICHKMLELKVHLESYHSKVPNCNGENENSEKYHPEPDTKKYTTVVGDYNCTVQYSAVDPLRYDI